MPRRKKVTWDSYVQDAIIDKMSQGMLNQKYGRNAITEFARENAEAIAEEKKKHRKASSIIKTKIQQETKGVMPPEVAEKKRMLTFEVIDSKASFRKALDQYGSAEAILGAVINFAQSDPATARWVFDQLLGRPDAKITVMLENETVINILAVCAAEIVGAEKAKLIVEAVGKRLDPDGNSG